MAEAEIPGDIQGTVPYLTLRYVTIAPGTHGAERGLVGGYEVFSALRVPRVSTRVPVPASPHQHDHNPWT